MSNRLNRASMLLHGIKSMEDLDEAIAELKEQIKGLKGQRKGTMAELKADGFDPRAVEAMIRERRMDAEKRRIYHAQLQIYRALLGMLDGTPLGEAARSAFEEESQAHKRREEERPRNDDDEPEGRRNRRKPAGTAEPVAPTVATPTAPQPPTEEEMEAARAEGAEAARAGRSVTDNPYPASAETLRSCFDEGWCSELGSDGMEIPSAFRRPEATQKPEAPSDDDSNEGGNL